MKPGISSLLIITLLLATVSGSSQIVNIESARMQSDTTGWMGGASAAVTLAQNVEKIFILNTDVHLQYKTKKDLWLILTSSNLLKVRDEKFFNNTFAHIRYNRKLNDWLRWEVFAQGQNNQVTQIASRLLIGTGPRFKILSNKIIRLYAASLVMNEWEKEQTLPVIRHNDIRNSTYASLTLTPANNIEIISTSFYQPLFNKPADYRFMNQSSLRVNANRHFSLSLRWNYLYDRFPAGTSPKATYSFTTGIDYEF